MSKIIDDAAKSVKVATDKAAAAAKTAVSVAGAKIESVGKAVRKQGA